MRNEKIEWTTPELIVINISEITEGGTVEGGSDLGIFDS